MEQSRAQTRAVSSLKGSGRAVLPHTAPLGDGENSLSRSDRHLAPVPRGSCTTCSGAALSSCGPDPAQAAVPRLLTQRLPLRAARSGQVSPFLLVGTVWEALGSHTSPPRPRCQRVPATDSPVRNSDLKGHRLLSASRGRRRPSPSPPGRCCSPAAVKNWISHPASSPRGSLPFLTHITAMKYFRFPVFLWEHYIFPLPKRKKSISL